MSEWETWAKAGELKAAISAYISATDYVSFAELSKRMGAYFSVDGAWEIQLDPNVVVWSGMSEAFAQAITELRKAGHIVYESANPLVYMIDGGMLHLPIGRRPPPGGYRKAHWLPLTIRPAWRA